MAGVEIDVAQSEFLVDGMTCEHCERAIQSALAPLDGVSSVQVSADAGTATIEHDERFDPTQVTAAVSDAGYAIHR